MLDGASMLSSELFRSFIHGWWLAGSVRGGEKACNAGPSKRAAGGGWWR